MTLNSLGGGASQPLNSQASLPSLPAHMQEESNLVAHLASRFHAHMSTASLSSHGLIALNNYSSPERGPDGGLEGSSVAATQELASRAWARLGHRHENQAVVFLGESGSGKTTLRASMLSAFLHFSDTPLSGKLSHAAFVFDSLTTTKSVTTPSASKAGLFFELQYDTSSAMYPTLIGGKLLAHRLERSRISAVPTGERNFHILYYLLSGTSASEKSHLGLDGRGDSTGGKKWRYLGHPSQLKIGHPDRENFQAFKTALRKLEFPRNDIAEICQVLAAILHIGQLEFVNTHYTNVVGGESGHEGGEAVTVVKNQETLHLISSFLGVPAERLQESFAYKTQNLHKERVTVMLDAKAARNNADELARTLYALLVAYIMETINQRICAIEETIGNTISIVDFPGFAPQSSPGQVLDQLLNNTAAENLYNICLRNFFGGLGGMMDTEEVHVAATSYFDNAEATTGLLKNKGVLSILDSQSRKGKSDHEFLNSLRKQIEKDEKEKGKKNESIIAGSTTAMLPGNNFAVPNPSANFTVRHFAGEVDYPVEGLVESNSELITADIMALFTSTQSDFVANLFGQDAISKINPERSALVQGQISAKPTRMPSMSRKKYDRMARAAKKLETYEEDFSEYNSDGGDSSRPGTGTRSKPSSAAQAGVSGQFMMALRNITKALDARKVNSYFVFCLRPNDRRIANQFDTKCVRLQMQTFGIAEITQRLRVADYSIFLPFGEFLGLVQAESTFIGTEKEKVESILEAKRWPANEAATGLTGVFLSERSWLEVAKIPSLPVPSGGNRFLGDDGEEGFTDSKLRLLPKSGYVDDKSGAYFGEQDVDGRSEAGVSAFNGNMFGGMEPREAMAAKGADHQEEVIEQHQVSGSRKRWMAFVWMLTFFIFPPFDRFLARSKRKEVRDSWREKFAINLIIWISCAAVMFFMVGFPELICPRQDVYTLQELSAFDGIGKHKSYVAIRGVVYNLDKFIPHHYPSVVPDASLKKYAGKDATNLFPVQVNALCNGKDGTIDQGVQLDYRSSNYSNSNSLVSSTDLNARYHDFRSFTNDSRPDWWWEVQDMLQHNYQVGRVGYSREYVSTLAGKQNTIAIINKRVYDLTSYVAGGRTTKYAVGVDPPADKADVNFMAQIVVTLFQQTSGSDATKYWETLQVDSALKQRMQVCLDNLFYVGDVDTRNSPQCLFAKYLLLAISILLVAVICAKFLAALQFGRKNVPENLDKFVICQVPAYTEDEDSLRRAIDSIARMQYDDKRKLLVVICDGMIIGQGNDRPTPRIVLDILGYDDTDPSNQPPELSFESLGEGLRQHNMGKVYSGLYEVNGHIVPYLVVVKTGKPSEVAKPGNRGKRDSQMIFMRFLNRVHYNLPMAPLELEMHHQIRNVIGVNPTFYEYILQVDADTVVAEDSATRMVSTFLADTRIIGVCGETSLTNAKHSMVTMIQVYEYYISHNLTKAFESLFGSVTCLPGCFSMYRIRDANTGKPLFVSKDVIDDYAENRVDTLHMKNLLHLGEDRYLTTLLLKHHPKYKTKYIFRAHAYTIAPDNWTVFLSQRRRWINSTVHNLIELIPLQQLCGFCCFSMRFIVFIDLLSTVVQPVLMGYIIYLIYLLVVSSSLVPITAFILLGAIYGLQAIIFIARRKWEMVAWMIIYIIATPVFSFALPLYAFWHMDDFTWGNTRIVTGEAGKKLVISDEGKFDPSVIPRMRWEEYQAELWEHTASQGNNGYAAGSHQWDAQSEASGISYGTKSFAGSQHNLMNMMNSRPTSQLDLTRSTNSRMSLAPTAYGALTGENPHSMEMTEFTTGVMPTDDQLLTAIRQVLQGADLMTVSKRSIKQQLEQRFGVDLTPKKDYISSACEAVLAGEL